MSGLASTAVTARSARRDGMAGMEHRLTIRVAHPDEALALPRLQVEAGRLFRETDLAAVADGPTPAAAGFVRAQQEGRLLVAVDGERVVGFARLAVVDDVLHVDQVSVAPSHGRRGVGKRLMLAVEERARVRGYDRITLTTFRDVPFNGPFYASLGWRALADDDLTPGLVAARREERRAGLDRWPRQAMVRHL
jgi:GNAT superfamily N-acetyltransferase